MMLNPASKTNCIICGISHRLAANSHFNERKNTTCLYANALLQIKLYMNI